MFAFMFTVSSLPSFRRRRPLFLHLFDPRELVERLLEVLIDRLRLYTRWMVSDVEMASHRTPRCPVDRPEGTKLMNRTRLYGSWSCRRSPKVAIVIA